jgi:hypothetical protein
MLGFRGGLWRHKEETEAYRRAYSVDSSELARFTAAINSVSVQLLCGVCAGPPMPLNPGVLDHGT